MKQTFTTKQKDIKRDWYIIDATDKVLGRLATQAADLLRGKNKPYFAHNLDCGDYLIIINSKKIVLTKDKIDKKMYYNHSGFIGGLRKRNAREMLDKYPNEIIQRAIKGMLPKNKLRDLQMLRLFVYSDDKHEQEAQKPKEIKL